MRRLGIRRTGTGFTLIELMVVIVVVAVLAGIAIPIYGKYVKNSRITEATSRISEIATACKTWAQEHHDADGHPLWPGAEGGGLVDLSGTHEFTYRLLGVGTSDNAEAEALTIQAIGRPEGKMAGVTVSVTFPSLYACGEPPVITGL